MNKKFTLSFAALVALTMAGCSQAPAETPEKETEAAPVVEVPTTTEKTYTDGTYRGGYIDGSVEVELSLKDNIVESIKYRKLNYKETNFLAEDATAMTEALKTQYTALIDYLVGKNISEIDALYYPGDIAQDIDGLASASAKEGEVIDVVTGATVRSGKIISAINDALNRGAYKLAE